MAENSINSIHINEGIVRCIDCRQTLEELAKVFSMPEFVYLIELSDDEVFILENIGGYQGFKNEI